MHLLRRSAQLILRFGLSSTDPKNLFGDFKSSSRDLSTQVTLAITAGVLQRHPSWPIEMSRRGTEFAMHGYEHWDHSELTAQMQEQTIRASLKIFEDNGIPVRGFRAPYLRANDDTLTALGACGLEYDSSSSIHWPVSQELLTQNYARSLRFYGAAACENTFSLPEIRHGLVQIPYSLPDDESLLERLRVRHVRDIESTWKSILEKTHELGELFVLGIHPERARACADALNTVLESGARLDPPVWMARLGEIATWWKRRLQTKVSVSKTSTGLRLSCTGPPDLALLLRGLTVENPTASWSSGYLHCAGPTVTLQTRKRPWIGVTPDIDPRYVDALRQQGYIVETTAEGSQYSLFLSKKAFSAADVRTTVTKLESGDAPLLKMNKWPGTARSALSLTGDVDAITLFDYLVRYMPMRTR